MLVVCGWRGNPTDTVMKIVDVHQSRKGSASVHHGDPLASGGLWFSERVWLPVLSILQTVAGWLDSTHHNLWDDVPSSFSGPLLYLTKYSFFGK